MTLGLAALAGWAASGEPPSPSRQDSAAGSVTRRDLGDSRLNGEKCGGDPLKGRDRL